MTSIAETAAHPRDAALRAVRLPHIWCPGCGLGNVLNTYTRAMERSGIPATRQVCVSGIGCTGRTAGYVNIDSYHTTHGRAIPFATGMKIARPELEVTVYSGDGDLSTIGGNHLIQAARRNIDLNVILVNNFNYGMTGGQFGATTPHGARTTTTPYGNFEYPFNLPLLMSACGASFVARWTSLHIRQLQDAMERAFKVDGFAFIEVVSPCPIGFGRKNDYEDALDEMHHFQQNSVIDSNADLTKIAISMHKDEPLVLGNFLDRSRESYLTGRAHMLEKKLGGRP